MAIHAHSTPVPASQRGLLPASFSLSRILADFAALIARPCHGDTPTLLPAPLPSLTSAFSRRRAIFGAVALAASPVAVMPAQAKPILSANDRRLIELADAYEDLERRCNEHTAAHRGDRSDVRADEFDALASGFPLLEDEAAETPADTLVGVIAKARLCQVPTARAFVENDHILSVVDDLHRLFGGRDV